MVVQLYICTHSCFLFLFFEDCLGAVPFYLSFLQWWSPKSGLSLGSDLPTNLLSDFQRISLPLMIKWDRELGTAIL